MSFFQVCPLPTDICHVVMDFVHMREETNYQKCIYEAQHYVWYATELCGIWANDMRPSEYKMFIQGREPAEIACCPLGHYHWLPYWNLFQTPQ